MLVGSNTLCFISFTRCIAWAALAVISVADGAPDPGITFVCGGYSNWTSTIVIPTPTDRLRFIGPVDQGYGNECEAQSGISLAVLVDTNAHSVELRATPAPIGGCPRYWAPVNALAVEFGPLPPGQWLLWSAHYAFSTNFEVLPEPPAPALTLKHEGPDVRLRWTSTTIRHEGLEQTSSLTNWQTLNITPVQDGASSTVLLPREAAQKFFRIKRSPILAPDPTVFPYPLGCGP